MRLRLLPNLTVALALLSATALPQVLLARPIEHPATISSDNSCSIDPNGIKHCSSGGSGAVQAPNPSDSLLTRFFGWLGTIWPDNSCGIDPNGVKHCTPNGSGSKVHPPGSLISTFRHDNSCGLDPNGVKHCTSDGSDSQASPARPPQAFPSTSR